MSVQTLTMPDADDQQKLIRNRTKKGNHEPISVSQKFAVVLLKLAPAVTQSDYPALKVAVEAVPGIQNVSLLVDGVTDATLAANREMILFADVQVRINDSPGA